MTSNLQLHHEANVSANCRGRWRGHLGWNEACRSAECTATGPNRGPNHAEVFLEHVRNRTRPLADVEEGHYSSNPGHLLNIAWRAGQRITWGGQQEQVIDNPAANRLVTKQYRSPWKCEV